MKETRRSLSALRWTARVWSVASVALLLGFIAGEGIHPSGANEILGLVFAAPGFLFLLAWFLSRRAERGSRRDLTA